MKRLLMLSVAAASVLSLSACSTVDNFFLGQDNTQPPAKLVEFKPSYQLTKQWRTTAGSGVGATYSSMSPAMSAQQIITADKKGHVMAVDRSNGKMIWKSKLPYTLSSGPTLADDKVALGTRDGKLVVLNAKDGKMLWKANVTNEILAAPTIHDNTVLALTIDGKLTAFDSKTGKQRWLYEHNNPPIILRAGGAPVVSQGVVIAGFADGRLAGMKLKNGELLWLRTVAIPSGSTKVQRMVDVDVAPVVVDNILYAASYQGKLVAVNIHSGNTLWTHNVSAFADLAIDGDVIYLSDSEGTVWAFNRMEGNVLWKQQNLHARHLSPPAVMKDAVVVADAEGFLHMLAKDDGHFLARMKAAPSSISAAPKVNGEHIYVYADNGRLQDYKVARVSV